MTDPSPVTWLRRLAPAGTGALVWITSAAETAPHRRPTPDAADRADADTRPSFERADFLARRGLLRELAASRLSVPAAGVSIGGPPGVGPELRAPAAGGFVSAARSRGWLALAAAPRPVGVDLEVADQPAEPAWAVLAETERAVLLRRPPSERWIAFLRLWTAKEAYLKALGTGLTRDPAAVAVACHGPDGFALSDYGRPVRLAAGRFWQGRVDGAEVVAACTVLRP